MILVNHSFNDTLSYEQEDRCMNIVNECSSHNCIIHSMCHSLISLSKYMHDIDGSGSDSCDGCSIASMSSSLLHSHSSLNMLVKMFVSLEHYDWCHVTRLVESDPDYKR